MPDFDFLQTNLARHTWALDGEAQTGASVRSPWPLVVASVQFSGDFGAAGKAWLENSNDGVTWIPMLDPSGAFVETSVVPQIFEITTGAIYVRPVSEGAESDSNIVVTLSVWGE